MSNLPLFPHAPEIPAETCRSLAESDDSWGKACGKLAEGCGDYSWGKPARGCGDYFWRKPAEAREGLRRLLGEAWGKLAKWRELAAKIGAKTAKWRELAAKLDAKTAKWREVARSS